MGGFTAGGYLLIDEIENHFNKEIVSTIIRLFLDSRLNKFGAVLIYSTHYPEILDIYDKNDSIYITNNANGLTATILIELLKRVMLTNQGYLVISIHFTRII